MSKFIKTIAIAAAGAGLFAALPASAATAFPASGVTALTFAGQPTEISTGESVLEYSRDRRWRDDRRYRGDRRRGYYGEPVYRNTRVWRGRDGRYRCRKKDGTTGLIIGGAVGALLGREVDGGYDRSLGTILGAGAGALLGREVDRGGSRCR